MGGPDDAWTDDTATQGIGGSRQHEAGDQRAESPKADYRGNIEILASTVPGRRNIDHQLGFHVRFSSRPCLAALLLGLAATRSVAAEWACEPQPAVPEALEASPVVLFGELHGTQEHPAFVGEYVCNQARQGRAVVLAMELPDDMQPAIDRYLSSEGTQEDRAALAAQDFWQRPLKSQDGRSSQAMLGLIDRMQQVRQQGGTVRVLAAVAANGLGDGPMAAAILKAHEAQPGARIVGLFGSVHSAKARGAAWDAAYEPVGYRLRALNPYTVLLRAMGGSAWVCLPNRPCGVVESPLKPGQEIPRGFLPKADIEPGFDASYAVGLTHASEPQLFVTRPEARP